MLVILWIVCAIIAYILCLHTFGIEELLFKFLFFIICFVLSPVALFSMVSSIVIDAIADYFKNTSQKK